MALIRLRWRPFRLRLPQPLHTARGLLAEKRGWLLRLEGPDGAVGWGEAAPLELEGSRPWQGVAVAIAALGSTLERTALEAWLAGPACPPSLGFALGAALAELEGRVAPGAWHPAPPSAQLLPAGAAALPALEGLLPLALARNPLTRNPLTLKWKVAVAADGQERAVLEQLLRALPADARLRLDANGGWDRPTAWAWAERLAAESRLDWLEQPLPPTDQAGLEALAARVPVALDESLPLDPVLERRWPGWQVRRPSQQGDPRPLLGELAAGRPRLVLSTAFETGIGRRWLAHLAALQAQGPTPAAPGLAPGWQPEGELGADDPETVWQAASR